MGAAIAQHMVSACGGPPPWTDKCTQPVMTKHTKEIVGRMLRVYWEQGKGKNPIQTEGMGDVPKTMPEPSP